MVQLAEAPEALGNGHLPGALGTQRFFTDPISLGSFLEVLFPAKERAESPIALNDSEISELVKPLINDKVPAARAAKLKQLKAPGIRDPLGSIPANDLKQYEVAFTSWIPLSKASELMLSQSALMPTSW
jgi:hypothetical protein